MFPPAVQGIVHPTEGARYTRPRAVLGGKVLLCFGSAATNMDAERDRVRYGAKKDDAD